MSLMSLTTKTLQDLAMLCHMAARGHIAYRACAMWLVQIETCCRYTGIYPVYIQGYSDIVSKNVKCIPHHFIMCVTG